MTISLSHRVAREWREYERTSSTVLEAYTAPVIRRYLERLLSEMESQGLSVPLHVMQSSGGVVTADSARERPLQTLLSGPVGGTMGLVALARALERPNLIGIDMGGTSFDVSLVIGGKPDVSTETSLEGFPLLMPIANIHTIGAGGGSLAYDEAGGLRVGPESAGADPGPCLLRPRRHAPHGHRRQPGARPHRPRDVRRRAACQLDPGAAARAVASLGAEFGLGGQELAEGIVGVINAKMAQAIRTLTVEQGIEPRDFALVAFGGAGPMHAVFLAQELGIAEVIVPRLAGAFSAWGMLETELRHDFTDPFFRRAPTPNLGSSAPSSPTSRRRGARRSRPRACPPPPAGTCTPSTCATRPRSTRSRSRSTAPRLRSHPGSSRRWSGDSTRPTTSATATPTRARPSSSSPSAPRRSATSATPSRSSSPAPPRRSPAAAARSSSSAGPGLRPCSRATARPRQRDRGPGDRRGGDGDDRRPARLGALRRPLRLARHHDRGGRPDGQRRG